MCKQYHNGLFPLPDSDSVLDSDSDSKPYGYIVLCRISFQWLRFRFGSFSQMGTVPILGTEIGQISIPNTYISIRGSESESEPMVKSCIVYIYMYPCPSPNPNLSPAMEISHKTALNPFFNETVRKTVTLTVCVNKALPCWRGNRMCWLWCTVYHRHEV